MRKVRVALGEESYDIVIGYGLEQELRAFVQGAGFSRQAMLVTDSNVGPLYGENVRAIPRGRRPLGDGRDDSRR